MIVRAIKNSALGSKRYNCLVCVGCGFIATSGTSFAFVGGKNSGYIDSFICGCPDLEISLIQAVGVLAYCLLVCLNNSLCVGLNALIGGSYTLRSVSVALPIW